MGIVKLTYDVTTYAERLTKIGLVVAEIIYLVGYADFCHLVQSNHTIARTVSV